jgi:putative Mg2+ transporter-C (MgtC) family protein
MDLIFLTDVGAALLMGAAIGLERQYRQHPAGAGFLLQGLLGTLIVLGIHLLLRPVGRWIDARLKVSVEVDTSYRIRVVCRHDQEAIVRTILLRHVNAHPAMTIQGIARQDAEQPDMATVVADIFATARSDRAMEDLMSRINIEPGVVAVRWEKVR